MPEENWHQARLIPTSGIGGAAEQERRAVSALLAVVAAVDEFGKAIVKPLGAPSGRVECFIEVPLKHSGQTCYPDGLIRVSRGKNVWNCLVEVKTERNNLGRDQVEKYLDIAKENGFDAVLTISNEIPPVIGQCPIQVDGRKYKAVTLHHFSWVRILSMAVMQKEFRGVSDPDQAWILGELIRYLEHSKSGALEFSDMGEAWTSVRDAVRHGTIRRSDKGISDVGIKFDALVRYIGLKLGRRLGTEVIPVMPRAQQQNHDLRLQHLSQELLDHGRLSSSLRIPGAVADLDLRCDIRALQVHCSATLESSDHARNLTRVKWLLKQLKTAPDALRIDALYARGRAGNSELLGKVRESPELLCPEDSREIKRFQITLIAPLGTKRYAGKHSVIDSVSDTVDTFYAEVLQALRAWTKPAPQLRPDPPGDPVDPALQSTDLSSQDGPDPAGAVRPPHGKTLRRPTATQTA